MLSHGILVDVAFRTHGIFRTHYMRGFPDVFPQCVMLWDQVNLKVFKYWSCDRYRAICSLFILVLKWDVFV